MSKSIDRVLDENGNTYLHRLLAKPIDSLECLIEREGNFNDCLKADPAVLTLKNNDGKKPLEMGKTSGVRATQFCFYLNQMVAQAVRKRDPWHTYDANKVLKKIAEVLDETGENMLHKAVKEQKFEDVLLLQGWDVDPFICNKDGKKASELTNDKKISELLSYMERVELNRAVASADIPRLEKIIPKENTSIDQTIIKPLEEGAILLLGASPVDQKRVVDLLRSRGIGSSDAELTISSSPESARDFLSRSWMKVSRSLPDEGFSSGRSDDEVDRNSDTFWRGKFVLPAAPPSPNFSDRSEMSLDSSSGDAGVVFEKSGDKLPFSLSPSMSGSHIQKLRSQTPEGVDKSK